ncbi:MAG: helix-turn-helix domain-containing protein [Oscillospiraceae bacterium]
MTSYVTGTAIKALREKIGYTQKQLADKIAVSDKAISKWETGRGLPDITLLEPLAGALGVSVSELLTGERITNRNRAANMTRVKFYICPVCGNVICSSGEGAFSCCGVPLPPLEAEVPDETHGISISQVEYDHYITIDHPQTREHHISFIALVTTDTVNIKKLYPEGGSDARFPMCGDGSIYFCCNRHGLYKVKL